MAYDATWGGRIRVRPTPQTYIQTGIYEVNQGLYGNANFRTGFMARPGANSWIDRKISAPTLLIWGEQDFALGKELTYGMEPLFTGPFEIKYIPDSGHWVQQEKPNLVNQYVRDFLESHPV